MRQTVAVAYKTDSEGGALVTSLCGVSPGWGFTRVASVDDKPCLGGLGRVTLTKDAVIEWKTEMAEGR